MVFPLELYAEIILHITDKKSLLVLLLTSRFLNQEAEKALYREIVTPCITNRHRILLLHLSTCSRVAQYVRSLEIPLEEDLFIEAHCALHSLKNLTALTLTLWQADRTSEANLSSFTSGVPFQLRKFLTDFPIDNHLKYFLQSQPQITCLSLQSWSGESGLVLSRADLPSLTALAYAPATPPIYLLFPDFFISNLSFNGLIDIPLPTVRALRTCRSSPMTSLPLICPNLQFLDTEYTIMQHFELEQLSCLQKLKMWAYKDLPNAADIILQIYTNHMTLKSVEICRSKYPVGHCTVYRVQERLNPQTLVPEPVPEICIENISYHDWEWATWQG